jgi:Flp pilus assembly protein TadG
MKQALHQFYSRALVYWRSERAGALTTFALMTPVLLGAVGISIDYGRAALFRTKMQGIADGAAISSARQLQLAQATSDKIAAFAQSYVAGQLGGVTTVIDVDSKALTVKVTLTAEVERLLDISVIQKNVPVRASASAKLSSGLPLCLLGLDAKAPATIGLEKEALLTAPGCLVYSNSTNPQGISSQNSAVLKAGFICSAGGKSAAANANFSPQPATDCPAMTDPLALRQPPPDGPCQHLATIIAGGSQTLQPGVYCGGLIITLGATVRLAPGVYTIKDGPFLVNGNSSLTGENVGIYLKGQGSSLKFDAQTTISLTAPKDGPMVGLLIFDDPTGASALLNVLLNPLIAGKYTKLLSSPREHLILSDNARMLLGTIYMPKGRLVIDATQPLADKSAYTVLVVQQLDLYSGPNLVLNSDYGASEIPVPAGLGIYGARVALTN